MGHARAVVQVHVVWSTWCRLPTLTPRIDHALECALVDAAESVDATLLAAGNADNHVHVLVRIVPSVAISTLVQRLKGRTSHEFKIRWQVGYYVESISATDVDRVARYIRAQRLHHNASDPLEDWIMVSSA